jgi:hypothetical protein
MLRIRYGRTTGAAKTCGEVVRQWRIAARTTPCFASRHCSALNCSSQTRTYAWPNRLLDYASSRIGLRSSFFATFASTRGVCVWPDGRNSPDGSSRRTSRSADCTNGCAPESAGVASTWGATDRVAGQVLRAPPHEDAAIHPRSQVGSDQRQRRGAVPPDQCGCRAEHSDAAVQVSCAAEQGSEVAIAPPIVHDVLRSTGPAPRRRHARLFRATLFVR